MANILQLLARLHSGRKQYATAATMLLLGVGVLTGQVDPDRVTTELKPVTFENVDQQAAQQSAPAAPGSDNLIGLLLLLLGADSAANRAAIAKSANNAPRAANESE